MLDQVNVRTRFLILIGCFVAGFSLYGAWSFKALNEIQVNGPIYQRIVQSKDLIADILPPPEYIIESYLVCLQMANVGQSDGAAAGDARQALAGRLRALKACLLYTSDAADE